MEYMKHSFSIGPYPEYESYYSWYMDGLQAYNPLSCIKFDPYKEILWCSSIFGQITGYKGDTMERIMSRPLNSKSSPINDFEISSKNVFAIGENEIYAVKKSGLIRYTTTNQELQSLQRCVLCPHRPQQLFVAKNATSVPSTLGRSVSACVLSVDVEHDARIIQRIQIRDTTNSSDSSKIANGDNLNTVTCLLPFGDRTLCCGLSQGQVALVDWRNPDAVVQQYQTLSPHSCMLMDVAVKPDQNLLVTCGYAQRSQGPWLENFIKVFDLRFNRQISCLPVINKPHFVRFLPIAQDRLLVASTNGTYSLVEFGATVPQHPVRPGSASQFLDQTQANISCMALSSTGQVLAMGGVDGQITLLGVQSLQASQSVTNQLRLQSAHYNKLDSMPEDMNSYNLDPMTSYTDEVGSSVLSDPQELNNLETTPEESEQYKTDESGYLNPMDEYVPDSMSLLNSDHFYVEHPSQLKFNFPTNATNSSRSDFGEITDDSLESENLSSEKMIIPSHEVLYRAQRAIPVDADLAGNQSIDQSGGVTFFFTLIPFKMDRLGEGLISDWPDELRSDIMYRSQNCVEREVLASGRNLCGNVIASPQRNNPAYGSVWFPYVSKPLKRTDLLHVPQFRFRGESTSEFSP